MSRIYNNWAATLDKRTKPRIDTIVLYWARAFDKVPPWHMGLFSTVSLLVTVHNELFSKVNYSDWCNVYSGVPQGSTLAPMLSNADPRELVLIAIVFSAYNIACHPILTGTTTWFFHLFCTVYQDWLPSRGDSRYV